MKDYIYKYVLTLVAFLFALGATAQTDIEFDEDDSSAVADTLMPDTFKVTEQALPWNIAVANTWTICLSTICSRQVQSE